MSVGNFEELKAHIGHKIVCVHYHNPALSTCENVAIECETCNEVLMDFDNLHQDKQKMTGKDLLKSGIVGLMKDRKDITDSVAYAKDLGDKVFDDAT
jgi:hypothetical protein